VSFWGWESAKKAGKAHLYLEILDLTFLAALVFCEALEEIDTTLSEAFKRAGTVSGVNYFSRSTTTISPDDDNYKLADRSLVALH
jgi:hypothetical protein